MQVRWTLLAMRDREAIFDYIEAESPQSAILVDDRIETQVEVLAEFPEIGRPGRVEGTREFVILRTPYIAAYSVRAETVWILRVLHGAQRWPEDLTVQ